MGVTKNASFTIDIDDVHSADLKTDDLEAEWNKSDLLSDPA